MRQKIYLYIVYNNLCQRGTKIAVKNALELLRNRYGDPLKVLATYRKETTT